MGSGIGNPIGWGRGKRQLGVRDWPSKFRGRWRKNGREPGGPGWLLSFGRPNDPGKQGSVNKRRPPVLIAGSPYEWNSFGDRVVVFELSVS